MCVARRKKNMPDTTPSRSAQVGDRFAQAGSTTRSACPTEPWTLILVEIAADLESQLEIAADVPGESDRFSLDGRLVHARKNGPSQCDQKPCFSNLAFFWTLRRVWSCLPPRPTPRLSSLTGECRSGPTSGSSISKMNDSEPSTTPDTFGSDGRICSKGDVEAWGLPCSMRFVRA